MKLIKRLSAATIALISITVLGACNEVPLAYGDVNSIIAVMSLEQWELVSEDVYGALEPRIRTVRDEKTFTVTHQEPFAEFWDRLRRFRQMLVVGSRSDAWVQQVLDRARDPITENGMHQVYDVWSRGQNITLVLLDEGWGPDDLEPFLPRVNSLLDDQFRGYARNRMYISGIDSALADTLSLQAGFSMLLPEVYRWQTRDSVFIFRNDNPDPAELIRELSVTWRSPASGVLNRDDLLEWRHETVEAHYTEPQEVVLDGSSERAFSFAGSPAIELQAHWRNPPERRWPAGGPFITWAVTCDSQDRTYLLDAWLYAPGKEKYEYMIQLETLLGTFGCTS